jgi:hypothetical protein
LQVLRVCKQFHQEAEPIYLAKNLFVLPFLPAFRRPLQNENPNLLTTTVRSDGRHVFSMKALEKVKNLSVAFCSRGMVPQTLSHSEWKENNEDGENIFEDMSLKERLGHAHRSAKDYLEAL